MEASQPAPRRNVARALVVLATLLALIGLFAVWVNRQVLDTDNWVDASGEVLEQPAVRDQLSGFLTDELYDNVDIEAAIAGVLPPRFVPLAPTAAGALRPQVEKVIEEALQRPRVQDAWLATNRAAHEVLIKVLKDEGEVVSTTDGDVVLDLKALLLQMQERVGIGGRLAGVLPEDAAQINILKSDELETAQNAVDILDSLPLVTFGLSLILFGIALAVSPLHRRQTVRGYGIGLVFAGAAGLVAVSLLGNYIVTELSASESTQPAVESVWIIGTSLLKQAAWAGISYGVLMIVGAWLAGPTSWAVAVRRDLAPYLREPGLTYGVYAFVALIVVFWWAPTPALRNPATALLLVALVAVGIEGLRRKTAREHPDAERGEVVARMRERAGELAGSARSSVQARRSGAAATAPAGGDDRIVALERLAALHTAGVLTDAELRAEKARIMGGEGGTPPGPVIPA